MDWVRCAGRPAGPRGPHLFFSVPARARAVLSRKVFFLRAESSRGEFCSRGIEDYFLEKFFSFFCSNSDAVRRWMSRVYRFKG